jgi:hypothetical protein
MPFQLAQSYLDHLPRSFTDFVNQIKADSGNPVDAAVNKNAHGNQSGNTNASTQAARALYPPRINSEAPIAHSVAHNANHNHSIDHMARQSAALQSSTLASNPLPSLPGTNTQLQNIIGQQIDAMQSLTAQLKKGISVNRDISGTIEIVVPSVGENAL